MALVKGTNCGFVTAAPTTDPSGNQWDIQGCAQSLKDTSPATAVKVTEIGWFCDDTSVDSEVTLGIYAHDSGNNRPGALLGSATVQKGTTVGWKTQSVNIAISASTTYWIAIHVDNEGATIYSNVAADAGEKIDYTCALATLPSPWGVSGGTQAWLLGVYAVWEAASGTNMKVNISDTFKNVSEMKINIGDAWKSVAEVKVNIGDAWKTVF